ncbi:MAG: hypothetical protein QJR03_05700 [Sphaerobacter sp.]|nr:hypothetical protein [Sphaerobacter sp.]
MPGSTARSSVPALSITVTATAVYTFHAITRQSQERRRLIEERMAMHAALAEQERRPVSSRHARDWLR